MDDRGQTLLVGAIGLAVLFVTMALVLNSAIYGSSLASKGSASVSGGDTMLLEQSVERDLDFMVTNAVDNHPGEYDPSSAIDDDQEEYVKGNVSTLEDRYYRYYAGGDRIVNVSHSGFSDGRRLYRGSSGALPSGSPATVAEDTYVREFWIHVDAAGSTFDVRFTEKNTGDNWIAEVDQSSGEIRLENDSDQMVETCSVPGGSTWINVTEATVDGDHCSALDFFERVEGPYDVGFNGASSTSGTYSLIVKYGSTTVVNTGEVANDQQAIYATNATVTIESPSGSYERTVRGAPGEPS